MPAALNPENKISKYIPDEIVKFLKTAGDIAAGKNYKIYLVGGIVRDLLLGRTNTDIDLAIDGNAAELVKDMRVNNCRVLINDNFGTAKIRFAKFVIDVTTARTEIYKKPGALPTVTASNILQDLQRRDFTINAMAISLNPENYGELIDPLKGVQDLKKKTIRVLHENSFIDDATRMWRAVRYEKRLGFTIEDKTLKLIKRDLLYLTSISGDRIRHELERVLYEDQPAMILNRAVELNILRQIHPKITSEKLAEEYEKAKELGLSDTILFNVYIALLLFPLDNNDLEEAVSYLRLKKSLTQMLRDTVELKKVIDNLERPSLSPSKIYYTLYQYAEEAVIANSLVTNSVKIEQNIDLYLTRLRHVKSRLNGNDLKRLGIQPGPQIKEILTKILEAKLDGKVTTKQGEIRLIGLPYDNKNNKQNK